MNSLWKSLTKAALLPILFCCVHCGGGFSSEPADGANSSTSSQGDQTQTPTPPEPPATPVPPTPPVQGGVRIQSQADLDAALAAAKGGEVFLLSGNFGMKFGDKTFTKPVILTSYDLNNRAVFGWSKFTNVHNLTFKNIDIHHQAKIDSEFFMQFFDSSGIVMDGIHLYGSLNDDADDDGVGLNFQNCDDVSVIDSEFEQAHKAMTFGNSSNLTVARNSIHGIRADGMQFAVVQNVLIDRNTMTNWYLHSGDHRDCIQFFQVKGGQPSTDVVITNNSCLQGRGTSMQGIFIADEQGMPNIRFRIENNVVAQTFMTNGIYISNGDDVQILNNTVAYATDYAYPGGARPNFRIGASNLVARGNVGVNGDKTQEQAGINPALLKLARFTSLKAEDLVVPGIGYQKP